MTKILNKDKLLKILEDLKKNKKKFHFVTGFLI